MHDPETVAHEIKYPWWKHRPWPKKFRHTEDKKFTWRRMQEKVPARQLKHMDSFWDEGYRDTFITIWHVDPQKDGSDDSCGYSYPKLTRKQRTILHNVAWTEGHNPHYLRWAKQNWDHAWDGSIADVESLHRGLALLVNRVLNLGMSFGQLSQYAAERTHINSGVGTPGDTFCYLPGWHTNNKNDTPDERERYFEGLLCNVARNLLDIKRSWWKHPKWHFWHWRFQVRPWQTFRRWAISRCCKCGKGFKWGETCVSTCWDAPKLRFLRSETHLMHDKCAGVGVAQNECEKESEQG